METDGDHHRKEWLYVACCPPNVSRILASLGTYVYAIAEATDTLFVNLYVGSRLETAVAGESIELEATTGFPWEGEAEYTLSLERPAEFTIKFREPGWAEDVSVAVNGHSIDGERDDGYVALDRTWSDGDRISLSVPMSVDCLVAHPDVRTDAGKTALRRGPLVYCLESVDNEAPVRHLILADPSSLSTRQEESVLDGVTVVDGDAVVQGPAAWDGRLYRPGSEIGPESVSFTAIPY
jgi:DUF1680 family protein